MSDLEWQKSSFSSGDGNTTCVEIAVTADDSTHLRESEQPSDVIEPSAAALSGLLTCIKRGGVG